METAFDELAQPDRRADVIGINALPQHLSSCVSCVPRAYTQVSVKTSSF